MGRVGRVPAAAGARNVNSIIRPLSNPLPAGPWPAKVPAVKFIIDNWFLILVAFISGGMLVWPAVTRRAGAGAVSVNDAVQLINREKAVLIDVSEPEEYAKSHATNSRNVPLNSLEGSKDLPSNKALPLVVVCATGARANRAVAILQKLGFEKARPLAGGMAAWREASLPTEKSA